MATEVAGPWDESEMESSWDLLDSDGEGSHEEQQELDEDVSIGEDAKESVATHSVAENDDEQNTEQAVDDVVPAEEPVSSGKKKKKSKASRAMKGLRKFVGGVFRPKESKLNWDVDASVSLKATYQSSPVAAARSERRPSESLVPKRQKEVAPSKKPLDVPGSNMDAPTESSVDYEMSTRMAILTAENEELRMRFQQTLNMQRNYNRTHGPICFCAFYSHLLSNLIYGLTDKTK